MLVGAAHMLENNANSHQDMNKMKRGFFIKYLNVWTVVGSLSKLKLNKSKPRFAKVPGSGISTRPK